MRITGRRVLPSSAAFSVISPEIWVKLISRHLFLLDHNLSPRLLTPAAYIPSFQLYPAYRAMLSRLFHSAAASTRLAPAFLPSFTGTRMTAQTSWRHITRPITAPGNRLFSHSPCLPNHKDTNTEHSRIESSSDAAVAQNTTEAKLQSQEPRLQITFTCTVTDCTTRSTHEFSRRSYERGIVIVQCPGCKNR